MDAGPNMVYPAQTVDGLVHQHGGHTLKSLLQATAVLEVRPDGDDVRCRIGGAILTAAPTSLPFEFVAHTPTPFWPASSKPLVEYESQLAACFVSALRLTSEAAAADGKEELLLAVPLLGAGARGAPALFAARVLIRAIQASQDLVKVPTVVRIVVPRGASEVALQAALEVESAHAESADT